MPLVQPDFKGSRKRLPVEFDSDILAKLRAYAQMCHASTDSVVHAALVRLFEADKQEFDAWLAENPKALDTRRPGGVAGASARKPAAAVRAPDSKA